jgi:putative protein-disulfide isomerase
MTRLIYIADPMCSWCYGFGPELTTLLSGLPDTQLELIVGGLRAYNTEVMDDELKTTLLSHWEKVAETSGLPFSDKALSRDGFVYDTEPACRAVVATGLLAPQAALDVFHAIQRGFYADGLDTTTGNVLASITVKVLRDSGFDIDEEGFLETFDSDEAKAATQADFTQTQRWGVQGFPTLVLEHAGELHLVTSGFVRTEVLVDRLQAVIDRAA